MTQFLSYLHIRLTPEEFIRAVCSAGAAVLTFLFGGADKWLYFLIGMVALDYATGVAAAIIRKELSSKRGFAGIIKKMLLFCVVAVANIIDNATSAGGVLRSLTIGFLLANEGISALENSARCGAPVPKRLIKALEQLRGEEKKKSEENGAESEE